MIDEICRDSEDQIEGEYDEFLNKRNDDRLRGQKKVSEEDKLI